MKKSILAAASCLIGIIALLIFIQPDFKANATDENILTSFAEELSADTALYYKNLYKSQHNNSTVLDSLQAGDYRMGVVISNSTGYCALSFHAEFDSDNYSVIVQPNNALVPVYLVGIAAQGFAMDVEVASYNSGRIGMTCVGMQDNTEDGEIVYWFLKRNNNADPEITAPEITPPALIAMTDDDSNDIIPIIEEEQGTQYHTVIAYYILGDVNGDGDVTAADAMLIQQVMNYQQTHNVSIEEAFAYYSSTTSGMWEPTYSIFIFEVADVDLDCILSIADVLDIQQYTVDMMLEEDYFGPIGQMYTITFVIPIANS